MKLKNSFRNILFDILIYNCYIWTKHLHNEDLIDAFVSFLNFSFASIIKDLCIILKTFFATLSYRVYHLSSSCTRITSAYD